MAKVPLSISLVKENVSIENILRDINTPSLSIENVGVLYYKDSLRKKPKVIRDFFGNKLTEEETDKLYVQAALLTCGKFMTIAEVWCRQFIKDSASIDVQQISERLRPYEEAVRMYVVKMNSERKYELESQKA